MTSLKSAFEKKKIEPMEVSYIIHKLSSKEKTDQNLPDTLEKIAACMNIQLEFENLSRENSRSEAIPFIVPDGYDSIKNDNDKVLIFGPSGCGKSRTAFEILREGVQSFDRIIIINPRSPSWKGGAARATGDDESSRLPLVDLLDKLRANDVVVWDNFPDDIAIERDIANLQKILQILSFKNVARMLIILKPKYLEIYKVILGNNRKSSATRLEIPSYEVEYSMENIKAMVRTLGEDIPSLKKLYETYVRRDVDTIANILWKKEPVPLIVLNYYRQLNSKVMASMTSKKDTEIIHSQQKLSRQEQHKEELWLPLRKRQQYEITKEDDNNSSTITEINAVIEAEILLPASTYHKHQVEIITNLDERQTDAEFLYSLKICYEIGLPRRKDIIDWIQRGIFRSHLDNPFHSLGTWLYLSGQQYSIHDVFKDAIEMPELERMVAVNYLVDKFEYLINSYYGDYYRGDGDYNSIYHLANFLGRNVQFLNQEKENKRRQHHDNKQQQQFLPDLVYNYMKRNRHFENGLGLGVGQVFAYLTQDAQEQILRRTELDVEFTKGLCYGLGNNFLDLDTSNQLRILKRMKYNILFSRFLGEKLGRMLFSELPDHLQDLILSKLIRENGQFADGIGMGLGHQLASTSRAFLSPTSSNNNDINKNLQNKRIYKLMKEYGELARGVGYGLAINFGSVDKKLQNWMWRRAGVDDEFAKGVGVGFAFVFNQLSPDFQKYLLENKNNTNPKFAFGFGIYLGYFFTELPKALQKQLFDETIEKNSEFACGLAIGFTFIFNFLQREFQQRIFDKIKSNVRFACGLGIGFGWVFKQLSVDLQQRISNCICEENSEFAFGFGWGMNYSLFHLDKDLQEQIFKRASKNSHFAQGLGFSLGIVYATPGEHFPKELKHTIYDKMCNENSELASGVGFALGYAFNYISNNIRAEVFEKAEKNSELAFGLGKGLGYILNYFSKDTQKDILVVKAQELGSRFLNGLGTGLGYTFCYISKDDDYARRKELLFKATRDNPYLASGLGQGLGYMYQYLPGNLKEEVFEKTSQDAHFSRGLGEGLGGVFVYLPPDTKDEILEKVVAVAHHNEFARGLGLGLGRTFWLLDKDLQSKVLRISNEQNTALARGLGEGMALYFEYRQQEGRREERGQKREVNAAAYSDNIIDETYRYARENVQFDIGLGEGLGMIFQYLPLEFQEELIAKSDREDEYFARGLGEGLGRIFHYLNKNLQKVVSKHAATANSNNNAFARGLGAGLAQDYYYRLPKSKSNYLDNIVKKYTNDNSEFALGIGLGAGQILARLPPKSQHSIIQKAKNNTGFIKGLGFSLGHAFAYLGKNDESVIEKLCRELLYKDEQFAHSFGSGIGQNFGAFEQGPQEQALSFLVKGKGMSGSNILPTTAAMRGYAKGLGSSLGLFFRYLNWSSRVSILTRSLNYNPWFATSLGSSLGRSFASFDSSLQNIVLQKSMARDNKEFARGFGYGLRDTLNYIGKRRQEKILSSVTKSNQYLLEGFNKPYLVNNNNKSKTAHDAQLTHIGDDNNLPFSDFPVVCFTPPLYASGGPTSNYDDYTSKSEEVSFSGKITDYCICYVDMISSTTITYRLNSVQLGKYYSIFLNSMSTIIGKFQGKIVKNVGDCLIFYFPKSAIKERNNSSLDNRQEFKNAIECWLAMVDSYEIINARLSEEKLPPLSYRISADYGPVELVQSETSKSYDLFGPVMNICAKINSKAPANGIAIGSSLYQILKSLKIDEYIYKMIGKFHLRTNPLERKQHVIYEVYSITRMDKKTIVNPFVNF